MSRTYDCADPDARASGLLAAADALRDADLVVLPTDTVYGLAADAFTPPAVDALLATKGRGRDLPVPVLVASTAMLEGVVDELSDVTRELTAGFWPGALTLVVRHPIHLAWDLGDARGTVAVRMPLHPVALELIAATGPLAVSSANRSGSPPALTAAEAYDALGDEVSVYLDGGPCAAAVPSTIVDVTGSVPRVLRLGAVPLEQLRDVVPELAAPE